MAGPENMFESVRQRFEESVESLAALRERLAALSSAEEHQAEISESIVDAAAQLGEMVQTLGTATESTQSAMAQLASTLAAATQFLQGSELSALKADVAAFQQGVASGISEVREDTRRIRDQLSTRLEELEEERDAARTELVQSQHRIDQLEKNLARMPVRLQRKFGFD